MTENLRYHISNPENNASEGYKEFSTIDFVLDSSGRQLVANSIRLEADVVVHSTGNTVLTIEDDAQTTRKYMRVQLDPNVGGHAFFESFQVVLPNSLGLIHNANEYPRYVKMMAKGQYSLDDYVSADLVSEMRVGRNDASYPMINQQAKGGGENGGNDLKNTNFCIKPMIAINQTSGGNYSFDKMGAIRISMNLARNTQALFGADVDANHNYVLENVRLRYITIPDSGKMNKMICNSYSVIKNTIISNNAEVSTSVPANAVGGVSISFLESASESNNKKNSLALEKYPAFQEVSYLFQDASNQYVSYTIKSLQDALKKGLEGLRSVGHNEISANNYQANDGMVLGLDFNGQFVDMTKNKFAINIKSQRDIGTYFIYLYFHSLVVLG